VRGRGTEKGAIGCLSTENGSPEGLTLPRDLKEYRKRSKGAVSFEKTQALLHHRQRRKKKERLIDYLLQKEMWLRTKTVY